MSTAIVNSPSANAAVMRSTGALARCNPVTLLAAAAVLTCAVLLSVDLVSSGAIIVFLLAALPLAGIPLGRLLRRVWFLPLAVLGTGWATALLAEKTGAVLVSAGPLLLTVDSVMAGAAIALRGIALALPAVVLVLIIDPTDLADGLVQRLRVPARFALAALAAGRLLGLWVAEWQTLLMARRARGVGGRSPLSLIGSFFPVMFALLVQAVRRGTRLAMAMEGRAFGAPHRSWARRSEFSGADVWLLLTVLLAAAAAIAAAAAAGTWNLILG